MKLVLCAVVAAVTVLSLTTAAVLPTLTRDQLLSKLAARRSHAPVPHASEEEYDKFWELWLIGYDGVFLGYGGAIGILEKRINDTEGFDPAVAQQVNDAFMESVNVLYRLYFEPAFGEEYNLPMSEVATNFHRRVAEGTEAVAVAERAIKSLVQGERPVLVPLVQALFGLANAEMTIAWTPTVAYLEQFLPPPQ